MVGLGRLQEILDDAPLVSLALVGDDGASGLTALMSRGVRGLGTAADLVGGAADQVAERVEPLTARRLVGWPARQVGQVADLIGGASADLGDLTDELDALVDVVARFGVRLGRVGHAMDRTGRRSARRRPAGPPV